MLKSEPNDSFLNYALALEYANEGKLHAAIELLEKIIVADENYLATYYQLGKYYEQAQEIKKAITVYQNGIRIAQILKNRKTLGELNEALLMLE